MLTAAIRARRSEILARWTDLTLEVYAADAVTFMKRERDRFQNPVGHSTGGALEALLDGLTEAPDEPGERDALDALVRIRAVQEIPASRALAFVFQLKDVLRDALGEDWDSPRARSGRIDVERRIDRLGLLAFELYMERRQRLYELRAEEIQRRTASILRRVAEEPATPPGGASGKEAKQVETKGGNGA